LANGTSYHDVHQQLAMFHKEAKSREWKEKVEKELVWVQKAIDAVKAGKPIYLKLLSDKSAAVRDAAAYLLASLQNADAETASQIWRAYEADDEERAKASFLMAFGKLSEPNDLARSSLLHVLCTQRSNSLKLVAALALTRLFPSQVPQEAIEAMLEALNQPRICPALAESPWTQIDEMENLILDRLKRIDRPVNGRKQKGSG
jgi:HEAT repeat protein